MYLLTPNKEKIFKPLLIRQEVIAQGKLKYEMYRTEMRIDGHVTTMYGLGIESTLFKEPDCCVIRDVSSNYEKVESLFNIIIENVVLPCTLKDIIIDYIS